MIVPKNYRSGFTLLELLVSLAIMGVIAAVVMVNYRSAGEGISVTNAAYQMAIDIRQAEVFGMSVKRAPTGDTTNQFARPYGVWLSAAAGKSTSYKLFADTIPTAGPPGDYKYNAGSPDSELVNLIAIPDKVYISNVCYKKYSTAPTCSTTEGISISYERPIPTVRILTDSSATAYDVVIVTLKSQTGSATRSVEIGNSGQISVID